MIMLTGCTGSDNEPDWAESNVAEERKTMIEKRRIKKNCLLNVLSGWRKA